MRSNRNPHVVLVGKLKLIDQEGGYAFPTLEIGGVNFEAAVEEMIQAHNLRLSGGNEGQALGRWVVTLTRYAVEPHLDD